MANCDGGVSDYHCDNPAQYINANNVCVCSYHKLLIDAFTWENRGNRTWRELTKADENFTARYERIKSKGE